MPQDTHSVIVAALQMRSDFGEVAANVDRLEGLARQAADAGAKIVVAPECAVTGYAGDDLRSIWHRPGQAVHPWFRRHHVTPVAEPIPGPTTDRLSALARERGIYLMAGMIERGDSGNVYNAAVLLSPAGEIAGRHRKRWPWPAIEPAWATPGDTPPIVCPTPYGNLGVAICYDIHRVRRLYAAGDLWTLLFPAAWIDTEPPAKYLDRRFPMVARALACNVVFANHSLLPATRWFGSGQSTVYAATGEVVVRSPVEFGDDVVLAELPVAAQASSL